MPRRRSRNRNMAPEEGGFLLTRWAFQGRGEKGSDGALNQCAHFCKPLKMRLRSLFEGDARKYRHIEWIDFEMAHVLADWLKGDWISNWRERLFVLKNLLCFDIQPGAFVLLRCPRRFLDKFLEMLVTPLRLIGGVHSLATEQRAQPVVGIAIIAIPAEEPRIMLALAGALQILGILVGDNICLDADFRPVGLNHLGHQPGIWIIGTLNRHRPERNRESFWITRLLKQGLVFLQITRRVLQSFVI